MLKKHKFYIYEHLKISDGTPFYVGKGCGKRAWLKKSRNKYWHNIVDKHGLEINIVQSDLSEDAAKKAEVDLIAKYRAQGFCEANMTNGGDGTSGCQPWNKGLPQSLEAIEKQRKKMIGRKLSEEHKEKIKKGSQKPNYFNSGRFKKGFFHSQEWKSKISKKLGVEILDLSTGKTYHSIRECARVIKISHKTIAKKKDRFRITKIGGA